MPLVGRVGNFKHINALTKAIMFCATMAISTGTTTAPVNAQVALSDQFVKGFAQMTVAKMAAESCPKFRENEAARKLLQYFLVGQLKSDNNLPGEVDEIYQNIVPQILADARFRQEVEHWLKKYSIDPDGSADLTSPEASEKFCMMSAKEFPKKVPLGRFLLPVKQ